MSTKSLALKIDKLWMMKKEVEADEKKLKKKKDKYNVARSKIIDNFTKSEIDGFKGKRAQVSIVRTVIPTMEDADKFYKYVFRNKARDMLKNGVATKAWRERIEAGKTVPGVGKFTKISLRLSKVRR